MEESIFETANFDLAGPKPLNEASPIGVRRKLKSEKISVKFEASKVTFQRPADSNTRGPGWTSRLLELAKPAVLVVLARLPGEDEHSPPALIRLPTD